jgi:GTPase SAR1 family protein
MNLMPGTIVLKILVVDEPVGVGKTCLLSRYCLGKFDQQKLQFHVIFKQI